MSIAKLRSSTWQNTLQAITDVHKLNHISIKNYGDAHLIEPGITEWLKQKGF